MAIYVRNFTPRTLKITQSGHTVLFAATFVHLSKKYFPILSFKKMFLFSSIYFPYAVKPAFAITTTTAADASSLISEKVILLFLERHKESRQ